MIVGIYGIAFSGKTYISNKLKKNNYHVINLDYFAKIILKKYESEIIKKFVFLNINGYLNYEKLKFIILNSISKTLLFNTFFSKFISRELSCLDNKKGKFILEGAILNFININFKYLFFIKFKYLKKINLENEWRSQNIRQLINIQRWIIKPTINSKVLSCKKIYSLLSKI